MISKKCSICKEEKLLDCFSPNSRGLCGRAQKCKPCSAKISAEFRNKNHNKYYAAKFKATEEKISEVLSRKYCEICGILAPSHRRHAIDHDHETGEVRGLLCDTCNKGLGLFKDNPTLLSKAQEYLIRNGKLVLEEKKNGTT
jgi:hypothetical protein